MKTDSIFFKGFFTYVHYLKFEQAFELAHNYGVILQPICSSDTSSLSPLIEKFRMKTLLYEQKVFAFIRVNPLPSMGLYSIAVGFVGPNKDGVNTLAKWVEPTFYASNCISGYYGSAGIKTEEKVFNAPAMPWDEVVNTYRDAQELLNDLNGEPFFIFPTKMEIKQWVNKDR